MAAPTQITVTVDNSGYPTFTIGNQTYHITLRYDILHVTTGDRGAHYGYTTSVEFVNGKWETVITGKKMTGENSFDDLNETVQKFIRKNYERIMNIKPGDTGSFFL